MIGSVVVGGLRAQPKVARQELMARTGSLLPMSMLGLA
jgi:hypothetical protein